MERKTVRKILAGVAVLCGVIAFAMAFLPQLVGKSAMYGDYNAVKLLLGNRESDIPYWGMKSSTFPVLAYLLILLGVIMSIVALCGKGKKVRWVVAGWFLIAALILIFVKYEVLFHQNEMKSLFRKTHSMGAGAIVAIVFSFLAAASMTAHNLIKIAEE